MVRRSFMQLIASLVWWITLWWVRRALWLNVRAGPRVEAHEGPVLILVEAMGPRFLSRRSRPWRHLLACALMAFLVGCAEGPRGLQVYELPDLSSAPCRSGWVVRIWYNDGVHAPYQQYEIDRSKPDDLAVVLTALRADAVPRVEVLGRHCVDFDPLPPDVPGPCSAVSVLPAWAGLGVGVVGGEPPRRRGAGGGAEPHEALNPAE